MNHLAHAIEIAGGQQPLAKKLSKATGRSISQGMVWCWLNRSKKGVPPEFCAPIEKITGVPREQLRPDVFGVLPKTPHRRQTGEGARA